MLLALVKYFLFGCESDPNFSSNKTLPSATALLHFGVPVFSVPANQHARILELELSQLNGAKPSLIYWLHLRFRIQMLNVQRRRGCCFPPFNSILPSLASSSPFQSCCSCLRSTPTCHKWHFTGIQFPVVKSNAGCRAGCGQWTWGQGLAVKSPTERERARKRERERERIWGQQRRGFECNNISEANVLFVDVVFGNLSAIFLAAAVSSYSALPPTLFFTLLVTDTFRRPVESFWLPYSFFFFSTLH